ncbi:hypothetical protein GTP55_22155 [Duganella sp. FT109W]|uniref:Type II secretion system protein n=1 Tax=Duganella margarita TaxID=2692170 RepID=A0ABW9WLI6_9BURK|nr:hypothetical protein [Duganella margarita]MYN42061.1 hypothetical protein [Duganella margarita]
MVRYSSPLRRPGRLPAAGRQRGAALLLLVLVLGVGAAAALIGAFPRPSEQARTTHSGVLVARAREALIGYLLAHGRLPRPAIAADDGRESPTPCADTAACTGILPWVTLGVDGADDWGKLLRYSVTPGYTNAPVTPYLVLADKKVWSRDHDNNLHYRVGQPVCDPIARCAVAVIFSSGKRNLGISAQGIAQANAARDNVDELQNELATDSFVSRARETNPNAPGGEFDDLVTWLPVTKAIEVLKLISKR